MRTLLLSVAFFGFTFAGVVTFLWALSTLGRNPVGFPLALVLFAVGLAFYRWATGRTTLDLRGGLRRLTPKRSWAPWAGAALVFVGLVAGGFDPSIAPALVIWALAGLLIGFGVDEPSWGRRVILLPLAVPSAAVFVTAMLMAFDTAAVEASSAGDIAQALAAMWLVLLVTAGPGSLVGVGIHRLLLRLESDRVAAALMAGVSLWFLVLGGFAVYTGTLPYGSDVGGLGMALVFVALPGLALARMLWAHRPDIRGLALFGCLLVVGTLALVVVAGLGPQPVRPETDRYDHLANVFLAAVAGAGAVIPLIAAAMALAVAIRRAA